MAALLTGADRSRSAAFLSRCRALVRFANLGAVVGAPGPLPRLHMQDVANTPPKYEARVFIGPDTLPVGSWRTGSTTSARCIPCRRQQVASKGTRSHSTFLIRTAPSTTHSCTTLSPTPGPFIWPPPTGRADGSGLRSIARRAPRARRHERALLLVGAAPLVAIIVAAKVGLWPDPNPNPVGPGMLFFVSGVVATVCLAVGAVWVWLELRQRAP
jgi:hypothetical protein